MHYLSAIFPSFTNHAIPRSHEVYAWLQKKIFICIAMNVIKILNKFTPPHKAINVYVFERRTTVAVDVSGWQK